MHLARGIDGQGFHLPWHYLSRQISSPYTWLDLVCVTWAYEDHNGQGHPPTRERERKVLPLVTYLEETSFATTGSFAVALGCPPLIDMLKFGG